MELAALTAADLDGLDPAPLLVVPVGSCEQHGPHLPLHTDTVIAEALARRLVERRDDCVLAPPLTITASAEHAGFAGTLSIGTEVMAATVVELVRSAGWASGVVFVNGHGGNVLAMDRAARTLADQSPATLVWWPSVPDGDLHAGRTETSLMLALAPELVRPERAVAGPTPTLAELVEHGVAALSGSGVLGDPSGATAEEGRRLMAKLADQLVDAVVAWAG